MHKKITLMGVEYETYKVLDTGISATDLLVLFYNN